MGDHVTFTLHLGVIDVPYAPEGVPAPLKHATKRPVSAHMLRMAVARTLGFHAEAVTTGDVAQWLENRYHVMEIFFEENQQAIGDSIANTMAGALDNLIDRGVAPGRIFPAEGQGDIQKAFNDFIDLRKMDGIQPGVPTKAAKRGVNHRLKLKKGPERPSFKDTGAYEGAFRAWVD